MTVFEHLKSTFRKGSRYNRHVAIFFAMVSFVAMKQKKTDLHFSF